MRMRKKKNLLPRMEACGALLIEDPRALRGRWRELLTPDEVRRLDNRYAVLLIRGAGPVMDLKYDLMKHPAVRQTSLAGGPPYIHHGQNQASVISGHELFAAFSTDDANEEKENAA